MSISEVISQAFRHGIDFPGNALKCVAQWYLLGFHYGKVREVSIQSGETGSLSWGDVPHDQARASRQWQLALELPELARRELRRRNVHRFAGIFDELEVLEAACAQSILFFRAAKNDRQRRHLRAVFVLEIANPRHRNLVGRICQSSGFERRIQLRKQYAATELSDRPTGQILATDLRFDPCAELQPKPPLRRRRAFVDSALPISQIGSASCRERVGQYGYNAVVPVSLKQEKNNT